MAVDQRGLCQGHKFVWESFEEVCFYYPCLAHIFGTKGKKKKISLIIFVVGFIYTFIMTLSAPRPIKY